MQSKEPSIKKLADEKIASMFLSFGVKFKKSYTGDTAAYAATFSWRRRPAKPALASERPG